MQNHGRTGGVARGAAGCVFGGGAYIRNEASVSTRGGLIHGGGLIFGGGGGAYRRDLRYLAKLANTLLCNNMKYRQRYIQNGGLAK